MNRSFEPGTGKRWLILAAAILVGVMAAGLGLSALVVFGGAFDVAADNPHSEPVYWFLQKTRQYSIAARATDAAPTDLGDAKRISSGAGQYAEMCSSRHLAPGMKRTEISRGRYPRAPELRRGSGLTPAEEFWVVKHGIKMTGMPAWGVTHDDDLIWDVVAFLRKLPELTVEQYLSLVKNVPAHDEMMNQMNTGTPHEHEHESR
ncbi:cytochrome c [Bradyrhizobium diazoefficiens]|nr:cytochrome c [Bradyrhizobium diazoefficiens]MBR0965539.1 cytochrome c [Bradyrhizobium diazoefficiens]MBR0979230.1 cytochrome c [Bradyrhizobium diazoefficiens]MBR1008622.1 cytochrome c [Bradyrhizobium diazoefficiens]MBR1014629.1 cytochrome c [Bradyrhizobium diazoefficiens]MBR1052583.1 cytochrome c [Bradyrhizobium diazoefficiens]